ncbi:MAG: acetylglutamate kinase [Erysipelotrichaceae bacterium]
MKISDTDKAKTIITALPYIQKYHDKVVVIKYGGNAMIDEDLKEAVMSDIVLLSIVGIKIVLVHGGGPDINSMLSKLNIESKFIDGLRYTDKETMEVVQMVLAGKVNKDLVSLLLKHQGNAVGLCGIDGNMIQAEKLQTKEDLGYVGNITKVNTDVIKHALDNGYIPVISTIGRDEEGNVYNINADIAASEIAASLGAENVLLLTDIRGLLKDKDDESTLISQVKVSEVPLLRNQGIISGGMIPKINCCVEAIRRGVGKAVIIDGRIPHAILIEILSDEGIGTMFS